MSTLVTSNISDGTTSVGTGYVVNGSAKVIISVDDNNSTPTAVYSLNVSSIVDTSNGNLTTNYSSSLNSTNYNAVVSNQFSSAVGTGSYWCHPSCSNSTASSILASHKQNGADAYAVVWNIAVHGDLA